MNRAMRIHQYGSADAVKMDTVAEPLAAAGEVIVRVHAAGINGLDWKIRDGSLQQVFQLPLPVTLGIELAGEVMGTGEGVSRFAVGDRVMGALGGLGAYADRVAVVADKLALIPAAIDDVRAAAIPVAALTASQALFEAGGLQAGQTVLIHGAAGGVGSFAVQLAKRAGAQVIVTAQGINAAYLRALGADKVIDYRNTDFRDHAADVDLVLDLVGGPTLTHSWQVLGAHGRIVSTAAPEIVATAPVGRQGIWFQMRPDGARLAEIAAQVAAGELKVEVSEIAELADAPAVIERNKTGHGPGKAVLRFL